MTKQWGGPRKPGPGKKLGRPLSPYLVKCLKIQVETEEEWQAILVGLPSGMRDKAEWIKQAIAAGQIELRRREGE